MGASDDPLGGTTQEEPVDPSDAETRHHDQIAPLALCETGDLPAGVALADIAPGRDTPPACDLLKKRCQSILSPSQEICFGTLGRLGTYMADCRASVVSFHMQEF